MSRDRFLDMAGESLLSGGGAALTIVALAQASCVSNGGVQIPSPARMRWCGLIDRCTGQFDTLLGDPPSEDPVALVHCYIATTRASQQAMNAKMAALLVSYLEDPANLQETCDWYHGIFARLSRSTPDAQAARVAFLAVEGLFLMWINGSMRMAAGPAFWTKSRRSCGG